MESNSIRPITDGELERIADHIKEIKAKCDAYEAALKQIEQMSDPGTYWKAICDMKQVASEALSAGEGEDK